jgi:hypothetical protein
MKRTELVSCMGNIRNRYKILRVKPEGKKPVGTYGLYGSSVLKWFLTKQGTRV